MVFKGFRDWNLLPALLGDTSTGQFQLLDIMSRSEKKTITIKKKYLSGYFTFTVSILDQEPAYFFPSMVL